MLGVDIVSAVHAIDKTMGLREEMEPDDVDYVPDEAANDAALAELQQRMAGV